MKLTNVIVQFTVTIPEIEVDKELGLPIARDKILSYAKAFVVDDYDVPIAGTFTPCIKDCPDYPALCD